MEKPVKVSRKHLEVFGLQSYTIRKAIAISPFCQTGSQLFVHDQNDSAIAACITVQYICRKSGCTFINHNSRLLSLSLFSNFPDMILSLSLLCLKVHLLFFPAIPKTITYYSFLFSFST